MVRVIPKQFQMLGRGIQGDLCVIFGVLGDFQVLRRNGAMFVEQLGSIQLLSREKLIRDGLAVGVESSRNVVAAYAQEHLPLLDRVAETRADIDDATGGQGDDRNRAGDVGIHRPRHHQF